MQLFWKVLLLFLLMRAKFAKEVNTKFEERNPDFEILHDSFEVENERDEDYPETEDDDDTDDDFLETEDDETIDEKLGSPEKELPSDEPKEEPARAGLGKCTKEQLSYFPHRLRDWFYIIKQELSERKEEEEDEGILLPLKESEDSDLDRKWVEAVLWKFCDLDAKSRDRYLTKDELFPLRDPLISMEPCIDPFLATCDSNSDTRITLQEWGRCLGLKHDEIKDDCAVF